MNKPKKVLIIKTGFSEFLDRGISTTVSLGDVVICTSLLNLYKSDHVTWITSWEARELLEHNPYIDELLIFGPEAFKKITQKPYDILINLEKDIGICTYLAHAKAKKRYGFYFNDKQHKIASFKRSTQYLLAGQENHRDINKNAFEILFETVGQKWKGEGAILNGHPRKSETYDIGFNYAVGTKWPTKAWPQEMWQRLEKILKKRFSISWQQGHKNIQKYIQWINSCKLLISSDSLGQIVAQALGKRVIILYGPTHYKRYENIANVSVIPAMLKCPHMPCYLPICKHDQFCMESISPEKVAVTCQKILNP